MTSLERMKRKKAKLEGGKTLQKWPGAKWKKIQVRDRWENDMDSNKTWQWWGGRCFLSSDCVKMCHVRNELLPQTQPPTPPVHPLTYTQSHILIFLLLQWTLHWLTKISERVALLSYAWTTLTKWNPKCNNVRGLSDPRKKLTPHNKSNTSAHTPLCGHLTLSSFPNPSFIKILPLYQLANEIFISMGAIKGQYLHNFSFLLLQLRSIMMLLLIGIVSWEYGFHS